MERNDLITSKDIIEKTGISRATLNNYIKMGILPKPIVGPPGPDQKGVKQIGYFPVSVLDSILKVYNEFRKVYSEILVLPTGEKG